MIDNEQADMLCACKQSVSVHTFDMFSSSACPFNSYCVQRYQIIIAAILPTAMDLGMGMGLSMHLHLYLTEGIFQSILMIVDSIRIGITINRTMSYVYDGGNFVS